MEKLFTSGYTSRLGIKIKLPTLKVSFVEATASFTVKAMEVIYG